MSKGGPFALTVLRGCDYTVKRMSHALVVIFWLSVGGFSLTHSRIGGFEMCVQLEKMS